MKSTIVFIVIITLILLILSSLASGLYYLLHDRGKTKRVVWSLTARIVLSLILFFVLFIAFALGWIEPHSLFRQHH